MFKVGDHVILIDGHDNNKHSIGWIYRIMDNLVGGEFVIGKIGDNDGWPMVKLNTLDGMQTELNFWYDVEWLVSVPVNDDPDTSSLDDFFSEWSDA